jgi:hypothetical protein
MVVVCINECTISHNATLSDGDRLVSVQSLVTVAPGISNDAISMYVSAMCGFDPGELVRLSSAWREFWSAAPQDGEDLLKKAMTRLKACLDQTTRRSEICATCDENSPTAASELWDRLRKRGNMDSDQYRLNYWPEYGVVVERRKREDNELSVACFAVDVHFLLQMRRDLTEKWRTDAISVVSKLYTAGTAPP